MDNLDDLIVVWSKPHVSFGAETPEGCQWTKFQKEQPPVFLCDENGAVLTFKSQQELFDAQLFKAENIDDLLDYSEAGIYITTLKQCKARNENFRMFSWHRDGTEQPAKTGRISNIFSIVKD